MQAPDIPGDEQERLPAQRRLNLLDTLPEERLDRLTRLASQIFRVPIALVSLVDEDRPHSTHTSFSSFHKRMPPIPAKKAVVAWGWRLAANGWNAWAAGSVSTRHPARGRPSIFELPLATGNEQG